MKVNEAIELLKKFPKNAELLLDAGFVNFELGLMTIENIHLEGDKVIACSEATGNTSKDELLEALTTIAEYCDDNYSAFDDSESDDIKDNIAVILKYAVINFNSTVTDEIRSLFANVDELAQSGSDGLRDDLYDPLLEILSDNELEEFLKDNSLLK